jgi:transcription elongation factor GreA
MMPDVSSKGRPVISASGLAKLEEELNHLKVVKRKEIAEQIKTAISFGDLSENAEYDEAKNEQARIEGQISQLENMIRLAIVVDSEDVSTDEVGVGSVVHVHDVDTGREMEYTIVGATEADPLSGRISNESPVGAALMGARVDGEVSFAVPDGMRTLKVLGIRRE